MIPVTNSYSVVEIVISCIFGFFLFLLTIIVKSLRDSIEGSRKEQALLRNAINELTVLINRDFIARTYFDKELKEIWDQIHRIEEKIESLQKSFSDLRAERRDFNSEWNKK